MSSFLETFGRTVGNLRKGIYAPLMEYSNQLEYEKQKKHLDEQLARQQAAIEIIGQMERQKELAADWQTDYGNNPEAENLHGPIPEWGKADELQMYHQYGQAGIDPEKIATANKAQMITDLFEQAKNNFSDNPYILAGLSLGKAPKAIELEDGQFYNPNVQSDYLLGTTKKNQAETREAKADALTAEARQKYATEFMNDPNINPMIRAEYARNGSVLKTETAEIVGEDGKTYLADTILMPGGGRSLSKVVDKETQKPVVIPPEAKGKGLTSEQINIKNRAELLGISESEALNQMIHSKTDSPEVTFNKLYDNNKKDDANMELGSKERLQKTMLNFATLYPDLPIPGIEARIKRTITDDKDQAELLELAKQLNSNLILPPPPIPIVSQPPSGVAPTQGGNTATAGDQLIGQKVPVQQLAPGVNLNKAASMAPEPLTAPPLPMPAPALPLEPQPFDLGKTIAIASQYNSPAEIRKAMSDEGMAVDDKSLGTYLITAINTGKADPADMNFLAQMLGIDLKL